MRYPPSSHKSRPGHVWRAILIAYACGSSGTAATGLLFCCTDLRGLAIDSELVASSTIKSRTATCGNCFALGPTKTDIFNILSFLCFPEHRIRRFSQHPVIQVTTRFFVTGNGDGLPAWRTLNTQLGAVRGPASQLARTVRPRPMSPGVAGVCFLSLEKPRSSPGSSEFFWFASARKCPLLPYSAVRPVCHCNYSTLLTRGTPARGASWIRN